MAEESIQKLRFYNDEFNKVGNISSFAGRIDIAVFDTTVRSAPIVKYIFNQASLYQFKLILGKIVNDPEAKPIEMSSYAYNKDLKTSEFKSSITIGRDQEKCIYFEFVGDKHKEPIRLFPILDKNTKINGKDLPKQVLTETGTNAIIEFLTALNVATLIGSPGAIRQITEGQTPEFSNSSVPVDPIIGEEIPF